jgi:cyclohexadienyl dehydratase
VLQTRILRVGTPADYAPFAVACERDTIQGADAVVIHKLAQSLGSREDPVQLQFVRTTWSELVKHMQEGKFDIGVGGVTASLNRRKHISFSRPYYHDAGKVGVSRCEDVKMLRLLRTAGLSALQALRENLLVAVNPGGSNEHFVRSSLVNASVQISVLNGDQFVSVMSSEVDVTFTDKIEAELWALRSKFIEKKQQVGVSSLCYGRPVLRSRDSKVQCAV